jgi:hypothetical protein
LDQTASGAFRETGFTFLPHLRIVKWQFSQMHNAWAGRESNSCPARVRELRKGRGNPILGALLAERVAMKRLIWVLGCLLLATSQTFAYCPSRPDGAESRYVENARERVLCLNEQLTDATEGLHQSSQFDALSDRVNNNAIERRFDLLPPVQPSWNF